MRSMRRLTEVGLLTLVVGLSIPVVIDWRSETLTHLGNVTGRSRRRGGSISYRPVRPCASECSDLRVSQWLSCKLRSVQPLGVLIGMLMVKRNIRS